MDRDESIVIIRVSENRRAKILMKSAERVIRRPTVPAKVKITIYGIEHRGVPMEPRQRGEHRRSSKSYRARAAIPRPRESEE